MQPIGVAVVGAGGWGKNHVRNFATLAGAELRAVCDRAEQVRARVAREYPAVRVTDQLEPWLSDPTIQAVVVATDAPSHAELARAALTAGKDVLVEKPLTLTSAAGVELCELAEARGAVLMVGHLLLYHPAMDVLRDLLRAGELGDVLYATCQRLNLGVVRRNENAWWSLAPHDISLVNDLLGAEPEAVSASGGVFLQPGAQIEDVAFATLYYPGGRLAHIHVSWLDPHKTRRLTLVGSRKMAVFDDTSADHKVVLYDKGVEPPTTLSYEEGVRVRTGDILIPAVRMVEPLKRECEAFLEAVRTREAPLASGRAGLGVVRVLEAADQSLKQGGARVAIEG